MGPFKWLKQRLCNHPINKCMMKPTDPSRIVCLNCGKDFPILAEEP